MEHLPKSKSISGTLAALADALIAGIIEQTPTLTEPQQAELNRKRRLIVEMIGKAFPPLPSEALRRYYDIVTVLIISLNLCLIGTIVWLRTKGLSVTQHLVLGYACALCVSWIGFYLFRRIQISFHRISNLVAALVGAGLLALALAWWLSPFAPVKPQPKVWSAEMHPAGKGSVLLNGTALLPPDKRLWLFVGSHQRWRPLYRIEVDFRTGAWNGTVGPDAFQALNCETQIAVIAVDSSDDRRLEDYKRTLSGRGNAELIKLPQFAEIQRVFDLPVPTNCPKETSAARSRENKIEPNPAITTPPGTDEGGPFPNDFCPHLTAEQQVNMQAVLTRATLAIQTNTADRNTYGEAALAQSNLRNQAAAAEALNQIAGINSDADALNLRGLVLLRQCRLPEALVDFQAAGSLNPGGILQDSILANIGSARRVGGSPRQTREYLENCVRYCGPPDAEASRRFQIAKQREISAQSSKN